MGRRIVYQSNRAQNRCSRERAFEHGGRPFVLLPRLVMEKSPPERWDMGRRLIIICK